MVDFNLNSEVAAAPPPGSTGYQPVPSGYQPLGTTPTGKLVLSIKLIGGRLAVPSGQWPAGTGRWPVLPSSTSAFGLNL